MAATLALALLSLAGCAAPGGGPSQDTSGQGDDTGQPDEPLCYDSSLWWEQPGLFGRLRDADLAKANASVWSQTGPSSGWAIPEEAEANEWGVANAIDIRRTAAGPNDTIRLSFQWENGETLVRATLLHPDDRPLLESLARDTLRLVLPESRSTVEALVEDLLASEAAVTMHGDRVDGPATPAGTTYHYHVGWTGSVDAQEAVDAAKGDGATWEWMPGSEAFALKSQDWEVVADGEHIGYVGEGFGLGSSSLGAFRYSIPFLQDQAGTEDSLRAALALLGASYEPSSTQFQPLSFQCG